MNITTIEDFESRLKACKYKYIALFTPSGKKVIPWSSGKITPLKRLAEIKARLIANPTTIYIIKAKDSLRNNVHSDEFPVAFDLDNITENNVVDIHSEAVVLSESSEAVNVRSYEAALAMQEEIAQLRMDVKLKDIQIESLETRVEELLLDLDEPGLSEGSNWQSFIEKTLTSVSPIVDKWFEQKDRVLTIQESALQFRVSGMNKGYQSNPKPELDENTEELINSKILAFGEHMKVQDQEQYQIMADLYNNAPDLGVFFEKMSDQMPDIFSLMTKFINSEN